MKILITGGSGFVGSTLCDELCREGHEVRLLLRKTSSVANLKNSKFSRVEGDLRSPDSLREAVSDVDLIFHVAGVISAPYEKNYFASNGEGTANLALAAQKYNPNLKRFVYISSLAAGGPASEGKPRIESDPAEPISIYGRSKLAGEIALEKMNPDFPYAIVRPPAVYGPRDRGLFTFFQLINSGLRPIIKRNSAFPGGYSFVHVEDLVDLTIKVGMAGEEVIHNGEIFYACGDEEKTWIDTMDTIAASFNKRTITVPLPVWTLKLIGFVMEVWAKISGKNTPLNTDKVKEISADYWTCSSAKAKQKLGFKPKWNLEAGFQSTAKWYQESGWL